MSKKWRVISEVNRCRKLQNNLVSITNKITRLQKSVNNEFDGKTDKELVNGFNKIKYKISDTKYDLKRCENSLRGLITRIERYDKKKNED